MSVLNQGRSSGGHTERKDAFISMEENDRHKEAHQEAHWEDGRSRDGMKGKTPALQAPDRSIK